MGQQTTTERTTIPGRTGVEDEVERMIMEMMRQSQGQMGDLSQLAGGQLRATADDRRYLAEAAGAGRDIAQRQAADAYSESTRMVEEDLAARGLDQSTIAAVTQALQGREYQRTLADVGSRAQEQTATGMLTLPIQRAETQLNANRVILDRLMGGLNVGNMRLQERLQQTTTTQTQRGGVGAQLAGLARRGGMAIATKGASEVGRWQPRGDD
jgi:hypothetical protein